MFSSPEWTRTWKQALLICLAVISCVSLAMSQAQSNAADLQGFVRDPNGAAVKGATVTARNLATNVTRDTTTNDDGAYQIISLPPGEYEVTAEAAGFSKGRIASVTLTVGQRAALDVPLAVGDVGAVVNIAAQDVALRDVVAEGGRILHPRGAVGVIVRSPSDLDHAYRVRFPDGAACCPGSGPMRMRRPGRTPFGARRRGVRTRRS